MATIDANNASYIIATVDRQIESARIIRETIKMRYNADKAMSICVSEYAWAISVIDNRLASLTERKGNLQRIIDESKATKGLNRERDLRVGVLFLDGEEC